MVERKEKTVRLSKKDGKKILDAHRKQTDDFQKAFAERLRQREEEDKKK